MTRSSARRPSRARGRWSAAALGLVSSVPLAVPVLTAAPAEAAPAVPPVTITTTGRPAAPAPTVPKISWASCGPDYPAFQCATVRVPTDYDRPRGATTKIAITRLPAARPSERIGSLFTNPGGPGGSGVDFVQQNAQAVYSQTVRNRFDIVGFDPRGVNRSNPATCFRDPVEESSALSSTLPFPLNPGAEPRYAAESKSLAAHCAATSPGRLSHMSTANVARDLELLRRAVGDARLNYAGYSYGTFLGATYAKLFPGKIRAMVLDGTLDPRVYVGRDARYRNVPAGIRIGQDRGGAEVFGQFLTLCAQAGPDVCSFAQLGQPSTVARTMFDRLKQRPAVYRVPGAQTVSVDYQLAVGTIYNGLYTPTNWLDLADFMTSVARALEPSSARVRPLPTAVLQRGSDYLATVRRGQDYPSIGGALGSSCVDTVTPNPRVYPAAADRSDANHPEFGRYRTWEDLPCWYLQRDGVVDRDAYRGGWKQTTRTPVLVLGTRHDPATPYASTKPFASLFPKATVITLDGWGHTTLGQSACTDAQVTSYLVAPTAKRSATTCQPDSRPFTFTFSRRAEQRAAAGAWLAAVDR
ncbi:pimeloyl-ACP methyl ester carboxylesterase [Friedmanniella endophytica]|uniref:Pimeloyl-ACP methyl ester carboxylesterase n=1 Tax=Microlunatus kandeliicorticis TaxID=1759536 RepID=A0A7W3INW9_9ACTN|nr:alpha/beta hydrolase [Microlunatus kandeliicorticis]MBA8792512.1 pimeloyl-ACP methyl ester carboxylesterase [Microlunatus kandeliicorticis]